MDADAAPEGAEPRSGQRVVPAGADPSASAASPTVTGVEAELIELRQRNRQLESDLVRWRTRAVDGWDRALDVPAEAAKAPSPDLQHRIRSLGSRGIRALRRVPGVRRLAAMLLAGLRALGAPG